MKQPLPQHSAYPASSEIADFATQVAAQLQATESGWLYHPEKPALLSAQREDGEYIHLDLTPFIGPSQPADAAGFFSTTENFDQLMDAYQQARAACVPEPTDHVHPYSARYLQERFNAARSRYSDADARLIGRWVSALDIYAAVKSVECLLDCHDNLVLFQIAKTKGWQVLFDHLAIRCGSSQYRHAETLIEQLKKHHGYMQSELKHERFYQFEDGWNAYPLYKKLENGQVLRLFIDQSDANSPLQIIQHWNRCYGFTAHHLALRVIRTQHTECMAVPLQEVIDALASAGIPALRATGFYTHGLLEQVFLKPRRNSTVPAELKEQLALIDVSLSNTIENGKLIELVSRRELPAELARQLFALYAIKPDKHPVSAPIYSYFLPAQAAHVILTSLRDSPQEL